MIKDIPGESSSEQEASWEKSRIKLSFIGHSMGGFVVTNTVRILSDVFDPSSVGSLDANNLEKAPSSAIGNVFSLGRLVLVSPDIPAETIISGRANFLESSLRRFEEAYLFSNEGDMALRLASTAANYFSYPSNTQDGGYRLGNVTIRDSIEQKSAGQPAQGSAMRAESYGMIARLPDEKLYSLKNGQEVLLDRPFPLDYLYIREQKSLATRQEDIELSRQHTPIGERFTFFDCKDLKSKPTALTTYHPEKVALSQIFSSICRDKGIQVLLAQERYTKDVLEMS